MIHFFRRIRQSLLEGNKIRKYFIYAIGEIALVVIGILLALQVNNWNQQNKSLKTELAALKNLKQEFESNKLKIERRQQGRMTSLGPNQAYNDLLKSGELTAQDIAKGPGRLDFSSTNPSYGVLNSLISSGDIHLIQPDSLRFKISNWKEFLMDFLEDEAIKTHTLVQWTENYVGPRFPGIDWGDYTEEDLKKIYLKEASRIDYRNAFNTYLGTLQVAIESCRRVENELQIIIKGIEERISELENKS